VVLRTAKKKKNTPINLWPEQLLMINIIDGFRIHFFVQR
jgi:hypothetical protein